MTELREAVGPPSTDASVRVAFVMEIGLGHTTFFHLLREAVEEDPSIDATWIPITFEKRGVLPRIPKVRNDIVLRAGLQAYRKLRWAMLRGRFDALFFHTQTPAVFCSGLMRRTPAIVSIDSTASQFAEMGYWYGLRDRERTSFTERRRERRYRSLFRAARHVVGFSQWAVDGVIGDYGVPPERTSAIYPGVDLQRWAPTSGTHEGPVRLLFVGGAFQRKGGDLVLRYVRESPPGSCVLDVVTTSPLEAEDRVRVHSDLRPNDGRLVRLYQEADLFVMPSRADMTPWATVEAMATGTPVVASTIGAIGEWVGPDGEAAFTIEPDDYAALRQRLDALIGRRDLLAAMGERARRRVEQHFDARRNLGRELDLIRRVALAGGPA